MIRGGYIISSTRNGPGVCPGKAILYIVHVAQYSEMVELRKIRNIQCFGQKCLKAFFRVAYLHFLFLKLRNAQRNLDRGWHSRQWLVLIASMVSEGKLREHQQNQKN